MREKALRAKEFDLIYKKGKAFGGRFLSLVVLAQKYLSKPTRFGIVISLKISKKAVLRNRKRRQLSEIKRLTKDRIKSGYLALIIAKPEIVKTNYQELDKEFFYLCQKAGLLK